MAIISDPVTHHCGQFVHPNFLQNEAHECVRGRIFDQLWGFKLEIIYVLESGLPMAVFFNWPLGEKYLSLM